MSILKNIEKNNANIHQLNGNGMLVDRKLDELVSLVFDNIADGDKASQLKSVIHKAITDAATLRDDKNEFSITLLSTQNKNRLVKQYLRSESVSKFVLMVLSVTMIILGLGMIIMPAPPFFEMFTIFYFNRNDGITVMDLISLIIILAGVYFLIKGIYRNPSLKKFTENNNP